ncbi:MAG TPA: hypothetical protein VNJ03_06890 [Vicinamibacterales bacterium]|nr:hypothetical protein [Vicinamibacterales bacterium]
MTDSSRSDRHAASADVTERDREALVEQLLVTGLDHYFAEQHELAISVWTRVLFIDRGHARARAYIERARSAIGERLRKGDELLHTGVAAFDRGDAGAARALLASAVEHGAPGDEALAVLARIERLEAAAARPWSRASRPARAGFTRPAPDRTPGPARLRWIAAGLAAGALLGAAGLVLLVERGMLPWPLVRGDTASLASPLIAPLPVPSLSEVALSRAHGLRSRGRLREALEALEPIPHGDPFRARADELQTAVQRLLLGAARTEGPKAEGRTPQP